MPIPHEVLMEIWYQAQAAKVGIAIPSDRRIQLSQELYKARAESGDKALMELTIQAPGESDELWICHKSVEIPEETEDAK